MNETICYNKWWNAWAVDNNSVSPSYLLNKLLSYPTLSSDSLWHELYTLCGVPQDPFWHPEGCCLTHTILVCDAMDAILNRENISGVSRGILMLAALTHDMGKATTTRFNEEKGKWTAYGHDVAGVPIACRFLESVGTFPEIIEQILRLVRWHMTHSRKDFSQKAVRKLARELQPSTISDLVLLMEADGMGRGSASSGLPASVTYQLIPLAQELGVLYGPRPVPCGV